MMEEGVWVEYEDLKAWVSSHHLVHEKYLMLQRLCERRKEVELGGRDGEGF